jgi:hypothetical protein
MRYRLALCTGGSGELDVANRLPAATDQVPCTGQLTGSRSACKALPQLGGFVGGWVEAGELGQLPDRVGHDVHRAVSTWWRHNLGGYRTQARHRTPPGSAISRVLAIHLV